MKLSFHTLTYRDYPLEETIKRIARIGYEGVEFMSIRPHAWPQDLDDRDRKAVLNLMKSLNIELASVADYSKSLALNMASEKEKIRIAAVQYLKDCINLAWDLECDVVMLIPGWIRFGTTYEQAWRWAVEGLKECMSLAEDRDMIVALEPAGNLLNSTENTMKMVKELGSKNARVCLDTFHAYNFNESPANCVRKLGKAIAHIHVWDRTPQGAPVPPGKGIINFELFIEALREIGYDGYLSVELPETVEPDALALESKRSLDRMLK